MMVKAYQSGGGTLRKLAGGVTLATGIKGKWVRLRIVHNLGANTLTIDVNGDRKWSGSGGRGGGFNLKYGNYGTGATGPVASPPRSRRPSRGCRGASRRGCAVFS